MKYNTKLDEKQMLIEKASATGSLLVSLIKNKTEGSKYI